MVNATRTNLTLRLQFSALKRKCEVSSEWKQKKKRKYMEREIEMFIALEKRWKLGEMVAEGKFRLSRSLRSSIVPSPEMETVKDSPVRVLILISLSLSSIVNRSLKLLPGVRYGWEFGGEIGRLARPQRQFGVKNTRTSWAVDFIVIGLLQEKPNQLGLSLPALSLELRLLTETYQLDG